MKRIVSAVAALLVAGVATNSWAAGFAVTTHGARATAMAEAVTAGINDPSATFFNPANITQGEGLRLQLGDTMILPGYKAEIQGQTTKVDAVPVFPPHLYATYGLNDMVSVGLGVFSPYGLALHWPEGWAGSAIVEDVTFQTFYINPEIAFKFDILRIGGGLQVVYGNIDLKQLTAKTLPVLGDVRFNTKIEGSAWGVGGNAGASIELLPKFLTLGAAYRSPVKLKFNDADQTFSNVPPPLNAALTDTTGTAEVTLPQTLQLGIALYPTEKLWIGLDTVYYGWQSFRDLTFVSQNPQASLSLPKNWSYIWNYHVGAEYEFTDAFRARLGFEYDPTPSPKDTLTPDVPDSDRLNMAGGLGFKAGNFTADLAYMYVLILKNTSTFPAFPATYNGSVHLVGLTLGVNL